jgi:hypothetical protein
MAKADEEPPLLLISLGASPSRAFHTIRNIRQPMIKMSEKMSFLLFGDQSLDTQGFLADFCRKGNPSVLSCAFIDRVASALQDEIARLPALERLRIPPFTSLQELNQRYHTKDIRHSAIDSALLVTTQLAHYIESVSIPHVAIL